MDCLHISSERFFVPYTHWLFWVFLNAAPYAGKIFAFLSHEPTLCPLSNSPSRLNSSRNSNSSLKLSLQIWKEYTSDMICKNCFVFLIFPLLRDHILFVTNLINKIFIRQQLLRLFLRERRDWMSRSLYFVFWDILLYHLGTVFSTVKYDRFWSFYSLTIMTKILDIKKVIVIKGYFHSK